MVYVVGQGAKGFTKLPCGVQIDFAPIDRPMVRAARRAVRKFIAAHPDMDGDELADETGDIFSSTLMRLGIRGWKGLGDAKGKLMGQPTPERIEEVLADPVLFDQIDAAYVVPWARAAKEKNGSSPSRNGTSTGATQGKTIAGSAAAEKTGGAKNAPTSKKNHKPTRAKSSGTASPA
jgi:hypothetical protein